MNKTIKKLTIIIICLFIGIFLASCEQVKQTKVIIIETALAESFKILGVENYDMPECEDAKIKLDVDAEKGNLDLSLQVVNAQCEFEEYKEQIVNYIEEAILVNTKLSAEDAEKLLESFEPEELENGYSWSLANLADEFKDFEEEINFEVLLTYDEDSYDLEVHIVGAVGYLNGIENIEE